MPDYYTERRGVLPSEVVVKRTRLEELERKERAHDAYMAATRRMRVRQDEMLRAKAQGGEIGGYAFGWLAAMREFAEEVVKA